MDFVAGVVVGVVVGLVLPGAIRYGRVVWRDWFGTKLDVLSLERRQMMCREEMAERGRQLMG